MLTLSPAALDAIVKAPNSFLDHNWEDGYHKLLATLGQLHPEWCDGVKVVPFSDDDSASGNQYRAYLRNLIERGVKLEVANCRSYWMITLRADAICLEYVSQHSDVFTGHGMEYFPVDASFSVFGALRHRVNHGMTIERSPYGFATAACTEQFRGGDDYGI